MDDMPDPTLGEPAARDVADVFFDHVIPRDEEDGDETRVLSAWVAVAEFTTPDGEKQYGWVTGPGTSPMMVMAMGRFVQIRQEREIGDVGRLAEDDYGEEGE